LQAVTKVKSFRGTESPDLKQMIKQQICEIF